MKTLLTSTTLFIIVSTTFGQSITPQVNSTCGEYFTGSNAQLSWTMGEPIIKTVSGTSSIITQGFQQPDYNIVGIGENPETSYGVTIFPNPTNNSLQIQIQDPGKAEFKISLTDLNGKQLLDQDIGNTTSYAIDLTKYAVSIYFLNVTTKDGKAQTFKIQKTN